MQNVINSLGTALGLPVPVSYGSRASQRAVTAYNVARAQWRDLSRAVEQAVEPGLSMSGKVVTRYGVGGAASYLHYPSRVGEGLAGAFVVIARISSAGANPDARTLHIQVLSADVWSGEDTTAEYSGTVADLK
jgi:hypothetical protein